mmetsp:Transcript_3/g.2  ORF Transcript_3/g.2 Transcript_3/m.2 type:complete len:422 (+) Transcript_3:169-1434(+)|eukprot:CAMPEP_0177655254 /NCGR_PEP_ID=MMETSP0447-20121125/14846_1 /TAXON_ID=0 /ORGANISM="Stygamoeba regulata, Strain BSH-02190019" /LENGTH=421 /DNA_ID=CAMNT_0019159115 /DNA_START=75 /DNA_END=1340 /DNA_ORIENTATION=-
MRRLFYLALLGASLAVFLWVALEAAPLSAALCRSTLTSLSSNIPQLLCDSDAPHGLRLPNLTLTGTVLQGVLPAVVLTLLFLPLVWLWFRSGQESSGWLPWSILYRVFMVVLLCIFLIVFFRVVFPAGGACSQYVGHAASGLALPGSKLCALGRPGGLTIKHYGHQVRQGLTQMSLVAAHTTSMVINSMVTDGGGSAGGKKGKTKRGGNEWFTAKPGKLLFPEIEELFLHVDASLASLTQSPLLHCLLLLLGVMLIPVSVPRVLSRVVKFGLCVFVMAVAWSAANASLMTHAHMQWAPWLASMSFIFLTTVLVGAGLYLLCVSCAHYSMAGLLGVCLLVTTHAALAALLPPQAVPLLALPCVAYSLVVASSPRFSPSLMLSALFFFTSASLHPATSPGSSLFLLLWLYQGLHVVRYGELLY